MTGADAHTSRSWTLPGITTDRYRRVELNEKGQEKQHFLLSAAACTLDKMSIAFMTDAEAYDAFKAIRFAKNDGEPYCPYCGCLDIYEMTIQARRTKNGKKMPPVPTTLYKCADPLCRKQFSLTSHTTFHSRKMSLKKILYAVAVWVDGVSGVAALRHRREIKSSYKTTFVFGHKLREAITDSREHRQLRGEVEVDGTAFNAYQRDANLKKDRKNPTGERFGKNDTLVIVIARERGGESRLKVVPVDETRASDWVLTTVAPEATLITDNRAWGALFNSRNWKKVPHNEGYRVDDVHINGVESVNSRIKRAARGVYYHIRDKNLDLYGNEIIWREDYCRLDNKAQWQLVLEAATNHLPSRRFAGYWERSRMQNAPRRRRRGLRLVVG